jgi:hypothetical protein
MNEEKKVKQTVSEMEAELTELELQSAKLAILEKEANLQDVRERLAERQMVRETKFQRAYTNGQTITQNNDAIKQRQDNCNHRKGGNGLQGLQGHGDDSQYAVYKHMFCNGDIWVRCLRCSKFWRPPVETWYEKKEDYFIAFQEYQAALNFQTRNVSSGSYVFKFSDGGAYFREVTRNSDLR